MPDSQDEWEEIDTVSISTPTISTPRPGATCCAACHTVTPYAEMTKDGRRWFCNQYCVPRRQSLGLM